MSRFLLVTKHGHAGALALGREIRRWLEERGVPVAERTHPATHATDDPGLRAVADQCDHVLVLGGDGTFLGVARQLAGSSASILGINFGRVGFLTEVAASDWREALEALLAGQLGRTDRTLLAWSLERDGGEPLSGHAVNDVVVGRGPLARVTTLGLTVSTPAADGTPERMTDIGWIRADGVLVSSPLGSSAYSLSARGPLVHPDVPALVVNAIAPFLGSIPPLVVPETACVRLRCGEGPADAETWLTVDGQEGYPLNPGDNVLVCGVPGGLHLVTGFGGGYLETLRCRGFIREFARECNGAASGTATEPGGGSGA